MLTRRHLFTAGAGLALTASGVGLKSFRAAAASIDLPATLPEGARSNAILDALPGKKPLIKLSYRPPNYETPIEYFRARATNKIGQTQTSELIHNPAGYHHNVIHNVTFNVA
jgi:hypothetical protein